MSETNFLNMPMEQETGLELEEKIEEEPKFRLKEAVGEFKGFLEMAKDCIAEQPIFYSKGKLWWIWDFKNRKWQMVDETDLFNKIDSILQWKKTVVPSVKSQILESLKRVGRQNEPLPAPKSWIQFQNKIVDLETGNEINPTPDYFTTNPIPWRLGESEETPVIDQLFSDWVNTEHEKKQLYELAAYCLLTNYPIHRIVCLLGSGLNGKDCYLNLIQKFVGMENITSSDIHLLVTSKFEKAKLYKKLVCLVGETNYTELKHTATLKALTGQSLIGFEFKNKNPFDDYSFAKIIIASNSLPMTNDKTKGFYRRWMLIDFPNTFEEGKDVIKSIPEQEFENLARKSIGILKELLARGTFFEELTVEEREQAYENKSNPLKKFIEKQCNTGENKEIPLFEIEEAYNLFLAENNYRMRSKKELCKALRGMGYEIDKKTMNFTDRQTTWNFVYGLTLKTKEKEQLEKGWGTE